MLSSEPSAESTTMIWLNGQPTSVEARLLLSSLIDSLDLSGKRVAVELNGEIVSRNAWATTQLLAGDRLEVVHAIGGG